MKVTKNTSARSAVRARTMLQSFSRLRAAFFMPIALLGVSVTPGYTATLLPPGKQTFFDQNGAPLSRGSVLFYIPGTTTPKTTWQNAGQTTANQNPVPLDSSGQAIIYGSGCYRQIVKDASGATIWDQPTCDTSSSNNMIWAGTSTGTSNSQSLTAPNFTSGDGQTISFLAGASNTGPLALVINGGTAINVLKDLTNGPSSLSGGEVVTGNLVQVTYDTARGAFHLVNNLVVGANPLSTLSGSGTTDLGLASSRYINITGTASIAAFGFSANTAFPFYTLTFSGASTLLQSAALMLPGSVNIVTAPGDYAQAVYRGAGRWSVIAYQRANASQITGAPVFQNVTACPFTPPTSGGNLPTRLDVEIVGAGGGGGGNGNDGTAGGVTSFNGVSAAGGGPGLKTTNGFSLNGGAGGAGGVGSADLRIPGSAGGSSVSGETSSGVGTAGGLGGAGGRAALSYSLSGVPSINNVPEAMQGIVGGGGAGWTSSIPTPTGSSGGGGGEYARFTVTSPPASIACTVGSAGGSGTNGGIGGGGGIFVRSFFN